MRVTTDRAYRIRPGCGLTQEICPEFRFAGSPSPFGNRLDTRTRSVQGIAGSLRHGLPPLMLHVPVQKWRRPVSPSLRSTMPQSSPPRRSPSIRASLAGTEPGRAVRSNKSRRSVHPAGNGKNWFVAVPHHGRSGFPLFLGVGRLQEVFV